MEQYIKKSALVAEFNRLIAELVKEREGTMFEQGRISAFEDAKLFLDTLEVKEVGVDLGDPKGDKSAKYIIDTKTLEAKEVDLEKETIHYLLYEHRSPLNEIMHKADLKSEMQYHKDIENAFKSGFELGLKASNPVAEVNLESLVRQVIDLNLEAGEHYDNIIKEERKEYGGSDLAIKLFDGVIDAKELGIQYVLDKLKAQKGE